MCFQKNFLTYPPPFAVGVSGGPDSMALLFWLAQRFPKNNHCIYPLIVNHTIRPESLIESLFIAKILRQHGFPAEVIHWHHPPLTAQIQYKARKARLKLLTRWCRDHSITHLFLAHHLDDQMETLWMRRQRSPSPWGLVGIQSEFLFHNVHIMRPLLTTPKYALKVWCMHNRIPFVIDPSNKHTKYERARIRHNVPAEAKQALYSRHIRIKKAVQNRIAKTKIHLKYTLYPWGAIELHKLNATPYGIKDTWIREIWWHISGNIYPINKHTRMHIVQLLQHKKNFSIAGCTVRFIQKDTLWVTRDTGAIKNTSTPKWDNRFFIYTTDPIYTQKTKPNRNIRPVYMPWFVFITLPTLVHTQTNNQYIPFSNQLKPAWVIDVRFSSSHPLWGYSSH